MGTLSIAREVKSLGIDVRDAMGNIMSNMDDFEVDGYRFISESEIDEIQKYELSGDAYMLGCFNAWFLAKILGVPTEAVEKMQESEAFEGLGLWVLDGHLDALQEAYAATDGYGHHFAHYDGKELKIGDYYVFRVQ